MGLIATHNVSKKYASQGGHSNRLALKDLDYLDYESESKASHLNMVSPTLSNVSEGITGIFVNEMHRNVVKGVNSSHSSQPSGSYNFCLPETENFCNTLTSLNQNVKNTVNPYGSLNNLNKVNDNFEGSQFEAHVVSKTPQPILFS